MPDRHRCGHAAGRSKRLSEAAGMAQVGFGIAHAHITRACSRGWVWLRREVIVIQLAPWSIADAGAAVEEQRGEHGERCPYEEDCQDHEIPDTTVESRSVVIAADVGQLANPRRTWRRCGMTDSPQWSLERDQRAVFAVTSGKRAPALASSKTSAEMTWASHATAAPSPRS